MAIRYYDDAIAAKLQAWIPSTSKLRVLKPDESKRLFETIADDTKDKAIKLPVIALSRSKDIELQQNTKTSKSFDGLPIGYSTTDDKTIQLNVIPIKLTYQMDIYTKTYDEGDEYLRNFLFKLINNPLIIIDIPYQKNKVTAATIDGAYDKDDVAENYLRHTANIRVLSTVSDTSDITEHLFAGQFTRWTIQLEIQDAMLFSIPYRKNWRFIDINVDTGEPEEILKDTEASVLDYRFDDADTMTIDKERLITK